MKFLLQSVFLLSVTFSVNCQNVEVNLVGPLEAFLGDNLTLLCVSPSNAAQFVIHDLTGVLESPRLLDGFLNDTHREFILNSTVKGDNGRRLRCGLTEFLSDPVTVSIIYFESIDLTPLVQDGMLTLAENSDFEVITYIIVANPAATINLTRTDGMPVNTDRLQVMDQSLMINGVSRYDAGMYNLTFSHPAAPNTTFFEFTLEVEYGPEIVPSVTGTRCTSSSPDSLDKVCMTDLGSDVMINCSVSANPQATLEVMAGGRNMTGNVQVDTDGIAQAQITIDNLVMDNLGIYTCIANNTVVGTDIQQTVNFELSLTAPTTTEGDNMMTTTTLSAGVTISPLCPLIIATLLTSCLLFFLL